MDFKTVEMDLVKGAVAAVQEQSASILRGFESCYQEADVLDIAHQLSGFILSFKPSGRLASLRSQSVPLEREQTTLSQPQGR